LTGTCLQDEEAGDTSAAVVVSGTEQQHAAETGVSNTDQRQSCSAEQHHDAKLVATV